MIYYCNKVSSIHYRSNRIYYYRIIYFSLNQIIYQFLCILTFPIHYSSFYVESKFERIKVINFSFHFYTFICPIYMSYYVNLNLTSGGGHMMPILHFFTNTTSNFGTSCSKASNIIWLFQKFEKFSLINGPIMPPAGRIGF